MILLALLLAGHIEAQHPDRGKGQESNEHSSPVTVCVFAGPAPVRHSVTGKSVILGTEWRCLVDGVVLS